jgi:hypothetical protein
MNPRVQRGAQFQHLAVMNRQILLPFLIPGHIAHERMDMKIGIFTQCEDVARVLIPDPALIKNKVSRPTDKAPRKAIDEFNPLDNL